MSVTIRLAKFGKRHQPSYRIVVANTRDKRNGRFLDTLGHYNPSETPIKFECDKKKYEKWISNGALVTDAVKDLVAGTYEFKPYNPGKQEKKERTDTQAADNTASAEKADEKETTEKAAPNKEASEEIETKEE
jgi:small subunit ribosomal protein S16